MLNSWRWAIYKMYLAMGIIQQFTHPHSSPSNPTHPNPSPPTQNISHPPRSTQKMSHSSLPTHPPKIIPNTPQLTPHPPKIISHPPKITHTQNNVSLTVTHRKYGSITDIYSKFSLIAKYHILKVNFSFHG